jgi:hypothetical protein
MGTKQFNVHTKNIEVEILPHTINRNCIKPKWFTGINVRSKNYKTLRRKYSSSGKAPA